jgi:hypothetical protein
MTIEIAIDPSPTAAATRLALPEGTSWTAWLQGKKDALSFSRQFL